MSVHLRMDTKLLDSSGAESIASAKHRSKPVRFDVVGNLIKKNVS